MRLRTVRSCQHTEPKVAPVLPPDVPVVTTYSRSVRSCDQTVASPNVTGNTECQPHHTHKLWDSENIWSGVIITSSDILTWFCFLQSRTFRFPEKLIRLVSADKLSQPFSLINSGPDTVNTVLLQHRTGTRELCLLTFNKRSLKILKALWEEEGEVTTEDSASRSDVSIQEI